MKNTKNTKTQKLDLNKPLEYFSCGKVEANEVYRTKSSNGQLIVVFKSVGSGRLFIASEDLANIEENVHIRNVQEKKPWTELSQIPLNAWFRQKHTKTLYKITEVANRTNSYTVRMGSYNHCFWALAADFEYTLSENPFGENVE